VRIEEMLIVHEDRTEMISTFPVQEITVAGSSLRSTPCQGGRVVAVPGLGEPS
jgi:hypothetical protein